MIDRGLLSNEHPYSWALMADKAYGGAEKRIRMITPIKTPKNVHDRTLNNRIGSVRVICENYYGRMKVLWGSTRETYRWDHSLYDTMISICISLTNYHLLYNPLREDDGIFYRKVMDSYTDEEGLLRSKQSEWNSKYRARQRERMRSNSDVLPR
eukprot:TRINITY_DN8865_c0_g1_i1.p1 TRINITY_DN8865_c0_g1~~TRINITY_DN8865_c0_g1_i1.p1  ORF type:complete len:154 (+),score=7.40 TRINITY_DN8865_c0_g1_i1:59-520(+)